jgi:hypothetical protein
LGGRTVAANGMWTPDAPEDVVPQGRELEVLVPAASAALVTWGGRE